MSDHTETDWSGSKRTRPTLSQRAWTGTPCCPTRSRRSRCCASCAIGGVDRGLAHGVVMSVECLIQAMPKFAQQLAALNRARVWAEAELGVTMRFVLDFARKAPLEHAATVADWAVAARDEGVVALGLGGVEQGYTASKFRPVFERVRAAGLARVPHAGETVGPASIWGVIHAADATRIGHGVRCLEDADLVDELRARQIPLEVCPTSNVCLGVVRGLADHPLPRLLEAGLYVTVNSDDPPMFNTTLTGEYLALAQTFGFGADVVEHLVLNAVRATLLSAEEREDLEAKVNAAFADLRARFA